MELAGLRAVALIHKNHNIALCGKVLGQGIFQIFNVFLVIRFRTVAATLSELMYKGTQKTVIKSIQTFKQILATLGTDDIFVHALVSLLDLLVQLFTIRNDQYARIGIVRQNPLGKPHHG